MSDKDKKKKETALDVFEKKYKTAVKTHLLDENGQVDYDRLDYEDVQEKFAKDMLDSHVKELEKKHGKFKDDFHQAVMLKAYKGFTAEELREKVKNYGSKLTHDVYHGEVVPEFTRSVQQHLYTNSTDHLSDKDVGDITKALNLEDKLSQPLTKEEARQLLLRWRVNDKYLPEKFLREQIGQKFKRKKAPQKSR